MWPFLDVSSYIIHPDTSLGFSPSRAVAMETGVIRLFKSDIFLKTPPNEAFSCNYFNFLKI